jgi:triacylglycerol lipase
LRWRAGADGLYRFSPEILIKTGAPRMTKYFSETSLLDAPTERAAFSDRQAYVCAELSKLAYFRFEGGHTIDEILNVAKEIFGENEKFSLLEKQVKIMLSGSPEATMDSRDALKKILNAAGFALVETFNEAGTQAFLCSRTVQRDNLPDRAVVYLAFRGTEPKEFQDIKTDINARLKSVSIEGEDEPVDFHSGYIKALGRVDEQINDKLASTDHDQLIICGHSLGGALAIAFTRLYASGINGACYTFGAPPVGAVEVQYGMKTPVYEIINELDIGPNLPNPWLGSISSLLLRLFRLLAKSVTIVDKLLASGSLDEKLEAYIEMMTRYRHPGYKSYLVGVEGDAHLRYNLGSFDKVKLWMRMVTKKGFSRFNKLVSDHMIDVYVNKLRNHALKRND